MARGGDAEKRSRPSLVEASCRKRACPAKGSIKIGAQASRSEVPLLRSWKPSGTSRRDEVKTEQEIADERHIP